MTSEAVIPMPCSGTKRKNAVYFVLSSICCNFANMFIVVAFIFMGIFVGYGFRKNKTEWLSKVINLWVWILLFLMGIEVGGNEHIMQALPTLGVEALVVSVLTILGSCVGAWMLWKYIGRKGGATR
jgi:uncharacterized membrane protein YbjE (DUF340 family)